MGGEGVTGGWGEGAAPLPMSTQAFVNEMITTVTVAQASANYEYSSIFGLGFETLVSYYTLEVRKPESKEKMRVALAKALLRDPTQMKADAEALKAGAAGKTVDELFETPVDPVAGASAWTKKLGLPCENQATRDATYFKAQKDMLALMKARDERNAANKAAGIETNDSRSLKNT